MAVMAAKYVKKKVPSEMEVAPWFDVYTVYPACAPGLLLADGAPTVEWG